jgi:hypothetical protein
MEVVGGRAVAIHAVEPLLLERNAEKRNASGVIAHHAQKIVNIGAFLNIVGEVEVGIVEFVIFGLRAQRRDQEKQGPGQQPDKKQPAQAPQGTFLHIHTLHYARDCIAYSFVKEGYG